MDSQDTLAFSSLTGIRPRIETLPLERAGEAYAKMLAGDARFRMWSRRSAPTVTRFEKRRNTPIGIDK
jgi:D-arabinose 1-dehydrogenase-like Zn-dependent alcohol dehydrogenase